MAVAGSGRNDLEVLSWHHSATEHPPPSAVGPPGNNGIHVTSSAQQQFRLPDVPRVPSRAISAPRETCRTQFAARAIVRHTPQRKGGIKYLALIPPCPKHIMSLSVLEEKTTASVSPWTLKPISDADIVHSHTQETCSFVQVSFIQCSNNRLERSMHKQWAKDTGQSL
ncbi:hypothetical protein KIN20_024883 [Parelaphostrongylus tenuis]|uniref:Uncharacterized protein n=1 Tax=Parelaphostrongylus tenuis TaxID=148309 RepID=A0AAD5N826_PARTN|nr:hypothetical protein KIN20_024883 [Parelaphostrongylus tenuis]